jgi:putative transposase
VPKRADQGRYLASESSFYRILRADGLQQHRGRAKPPVRRKPPTSYQASAPCEVWTWDITWMPGPVAGLFFYLYLIVDIFGRKIVGWEVHERESADLAAILIRQAVLAEGCHLRPLVLHADPNSRTGAPPSRACKSMHCRAMNDGSHDENDDGTIGYHRVLQPPAYPQ